LLSTLLLLITIASGAGIQPVAAATAGPSGSHTSTADPAVSVVGNQLVGGDGVPTRLIGVDHSGSEYACIQGWGIFDPADTDSPAMIDAMKSWDVNTVRVPLNEDCWLGINMSAPQYGGSAYQAAITHYVDDLNAAGLVVILDLHWNAPGTQAATGQADMADEDHAPGFWSSVATVFKGHQGVVFDLYNEPHDITWACLVGGCQVNGSGVAGYDQLIGDVRATGATNVIMVAGLDWAGDPTGSYTGPGGYPGDVPYDPLGQLAVSVHEYGSGDDATLWNRWLPLLARVPVISGEIGEYDCASTFITDYMDWADAHGVSYLAWTFNGGGGRSCSNGPALTTDDAGDPTPYGLGFKDHLMSLVPPSSTTTDTHAPVEPVAPAVPSRPITPVGVAQPGSLPVGTTIALLATASGAGYDEVTSDGGVVPFGDAAFYGSMQGVHLNSPIVGASLTPDGHGYWLAAADGGIFSFGDADFYGSGGSLRLNRPITAFMATPDGHGYWEVASDGGVFAYGDAPFLGSTGALRLNRPVVGMAATGGGHGYLLVASDGGIFAFGDARFFGSTSSLRLNGPITGMGTSPDTSGYWLIGADGGVFGGVPSSGGL